MTHDDTATPTGVRAAARAERPDVLTPLRELLIADEAATVLIGIDGTPIDANAAGAALFGTPQVPTADGRLALRDVLDQVPQQLLLDPEGGVWRGEIDLPQPIEGRRTYASTVLVRHDVQSPHGGYIAVLCRDVTDERLRAGQLMHLLEHDATTGLLNRSAALERTGCIDARLRD